MRATVATYADVDPRNSAKPDTIPAYIVWLSSTRMHVLPAYPPCRNGHHYKDALLVAQLGARWFLVKLKNIVKPSADQELEVEVLTAFTEQVWPDSDLYSAAAWAINAYRWWRWNVLLHSDMFGIWDIRLSEAVDKMRRAAHLSTSDSAIDPPAWIQRYHNCILNDQYCGPSTTKFVALEIEKKVLKIKENGHKRKGHVFMNDFEWKQARRRDIFAINRLWAEARAGQTYTVHAGEQLAQVTVGIGQESDPGWQMLPIIYEEQIGKQFGPSIKIS
jgi:hypothetical protein